MSPFRVRFQPITCMPEHAPLVTTHRELPGSRRRAKSKLGCRQCKAKRVKCDETFPVCLRCRRQGLICSSTPRLTPWQYEPYWVSSPMDAIINRRLLQYWLERVSQTLVLDPDDNPYSFPILGHITKSCSLMHIIQSISAYHEHYFSAQASVIALEERGKALASFRKEIDGPKTAPQASLLTAMLLALSHGADDDMADFGKQHLFAARILINKLLQHTSHLLEHDDLSRLCFGMYLYWEMCTAFLVDPSEKQEFNTLNLAIAVQRMGRWHHPMYGYGTELVFILVGVGRYCRHRLHSPRCNPTQETILEQQLLKWNGCSANSSLEHLYEALRKHGLILLYRICGCNGCFSNPDLKEFSLEALILNYAVETVHHLLEIPMTSNYLNFQSLPLLAAGSELKRTDFCLRNQVLQRLRAVYSLNRLPVNLRVVQLLEELWILRDNGDSSSWLHHMLRKGWRLLLG
ncbi:unnamed protein product [Penicillium egyptiacum]|uniref:Zn(2)-C6 fungal-type domain-containing protein n=1 Tax=Penicillium egyptiacum TaxID=1303716 RepID=A0A9W4P7M2_9EURO|nr:unnamed protein product [Penicillium egyptiacum]